MEKQEMNDMLASTFGDTKLSRSGKKALSAWLTNYGDDRRMLRSLSSRAFEMAKEAVSTSNDIAILNWLEGIMKATLGQTRLPETPTGDVWFSPGSQCRDALDKHISETNLTLDICVFTITDNHLRDKILDASNRGVKVRIITDNEKMEDIGSDIENFSRNGIPVKIDNTKYHMHHKFAIFDRKQLATGSYNWTRSAFTMNNENLVVLGHRKIVTSFQKEFEQLWSSLDQV